MNSVDFNPGDQVLLARGSLWTGQQITLDDADDGSAVAWVTLDAYGSGARPITEWTHAANQILINAVNVDYWSVKNIEVRQAHIGMYFNYTTIGHQGLRFDNIYVHDMFYDASDGSIYDGAGFYVAASGAPPSGTSFYINDVQITNVEAKNTAYAPGLFYGDPGCPSDKCDVGDPIQNVTFKNNYFHDIEGATSVQDIATLTIVDNRFINMATVSQSQGTTNLFFWHTSNATVANNVIKTIPNTPSTDLSHVDLEGWTNDVRFHNNYFTDAAGAAIQFQLWVMGSYLTNIDMNGNLFNRNVTAGGSGAVDFVPNCKVKPSGALANSLYYEPGGLFTPGNCAHTITLTANTDVGSTASFSVGGLDYSTLDCSTSGGTTWSYRYSTDTGSTWTNLSYVNNLGVTDERCQIDAATTAPYVNRFQQLPGAATTSAAARQWKAATAGTVNIRSRILKYETGGDGVHARITKNGTQIWPGSGWQLVGASDQVGVVANISALTVAAGDLIRFELKNNADNTSDRTSWNPLISFVSSGGGGGGDTSLVTSHTVGALRNDTTTDVGMRVAIGASAITATQIGRYFASGNSGTHTLRIVRKSDGVEMASVSINMGTGTADALGFKYATLASPVTLAASTTYYVVSSETTGGDQFADNVGTNQTPTGVATLPGSVYWNGTGWTENGGTSDDSYGPMNIKYQ